jgi:RNA polymerase subunit RPABC4/transcription elongation factor Spt4
MSRFATELDEFVYALTLDGTCPWIDNGGDVSVDWYGFVEITDEDRRAAEAATGEYLPWPAAIVHENDQGFVDVTFYDTKAEADTEDAE